jgi:hypothetical protein
MTDPAIALAQPVTPTRYWTMQRMTHDLLTVA